MEGMRTMVSSFPRSFDFRNIQSIFPHNNPKNKNRQEFSGRISLPYVMAISKNRETSSGSSICSFQPRFNAMGREFRVNLAN